MRLEDLTFEVRDRTLARVGQVTAQFLSLKVISRWCGVGEWTVTLPGSHPMVSFLSTPGSGMILTGPAGVIMSGPTVVPARKRDSMNPDGTYTFTGVSDEQHLADALAFPQPGNSNPATQTVTNDVRVGATEKLLREYVAFNIANGAIAPGGAVSWAPAGRLRGVRPKVTLEALPGGHRGVTQSKSPRFQNLLELLRETIIFDPALGFRLVQVGNVLQFQVRAVRDRRGEIRFDVENGTLTSEEMQTTGPGVTYAIVAGQGEGTERTIVPVTSSEMIAAETSYGRVRETFIDQRNTDDDVELQQSGVEAIAAAAGGTSVKVIPADQSTMEYQRDWYEGDTVKIVVSGAEAATTVTEAVLLANPDGVRVGAALGSVQEFTPADSLGSKVDALDNRVSSLERSSISGLPEGSFPQYNGGTILASAGPNTFPVGVTYGVAGSDMPAIYGEVEVIYFSGDRAVQYIHEKDGKARSWRRGATAGNWNEWRLVGAIAGEIKIWPGGAAPYGALVCNGQAISRTDYAELFAEIGTQYGTGDGSTTFNVPNLNGRTVVGLDTSQTEFNARGKTGGAKTHLLLVSEMPSHTHLQNAHTHTQNAHGHAATTGSDGAHTHPGITVGATSIKWASGGTDGVTAGGTAGIRASGSADLIIQSAGGHTHSVAVADATAVNQNATAVNQNAGGGGEHNNLQPYNTMYYVIMA